MRLESPSNLVSTTVSIICDSPQKDKKGKPTTRWDILKSLTLR